ncbi:MAG: hypothetical protein ACI8Y7_001167 [Candidatus Woesearchaeota archaeon]|jgi:hypothetical protein
MLVRVRNLLVEFGFSETLDSFIVRPFLMWFFQVWFGNVALGLLVGNILADVSFYIPTIISYELRKKHLKD